LIRKIERPALKLATYINSVWPYYKADEKLMANYGKIAMAGVKESTEVLASLKPDIEAFKKESSSS
jgi:hypothetical protein